MNLGSWIYHFSWKIPPECRKQWKINAGFCSNSRSLDHQHWQDEDREVGVGMMEEQPERLMWAILKPRWKPTDRRSCTNILRHQQRFFCRCIRLQKCLVALFWSMWLDFTHSHGWFSCWKKHLHGWIYSQIFDQRLVNLTLSLVLSDPYSSFTV